MKSGCGDSRGGSGSGGGGGGVVVETNEVDAVVEISTVCNHSFYYRWNTCRSVCFVPVPNFRLLLDSYFDHNLFHLLGQPQTSGILHIAHTKC